MKIFNVPSDLGNIKEKFTINTSSKSNFKKAQIIKQAFDFHSKGNIIEAAKYYQYYINQGFKDHRVFSNYGSILESVGKSDEAKLFYLEAIKNKPDIAEAHYNLGNLLKNQGELEEAKINYLNAIKIKPDMAEAYSNLGIIYQDLNELDKAEIFTIAAIKQNKNLAEAHNNLGNILSRLGKIKDAEKSYKKGIRLNKKLYLGLFSLYQCLGEYEKYKNCFKKLYLLKIFDDSDLIVINSQMLMQSLVKGELEQIPSRLNKTRKLINDGGYKKIKNIKIRSNAIRSYQFVNKIYPLLDKKMINSDKREIPHIGESHSLSFTHQEILLFEESRIIKPVWIPNCYAWNFARRGMNQYKAYLINQYNKYKNSEEILISFGEIDCRENEGIIPYSRKYNKDILEVTKDTIDGYLHYMENILSKPYKKRYYFGVAAPRLNEKEIIQSKTNRKILIKEYNKYLKQEVLKYGSSFLDVYELTSNNNGDNNGLYMCDENHLSPKCLYTLFNNHLY